MIEDWICPTALPPHSLVKPASSGSVDVGGKMAADADTDLEQTGDGQSGGRLEEGSALHHGILPIHLLFMILGSLLVLLVIIAVISYHKAMS